MTSSDDDQDKTHGCLACETGYPPGWHHALGCEHSRKPEPGETVTAAKHVDFSEPGIIPLQSPPFGD